jgi:hypothetical protein
MRYQVREFIFLASMDNCILRNYIPVLDGQ